MEAASGMGLTWLCGRFPVLCQHELLMEVNNIVGGSMCSTEIPAFNEENKYSPLCTFLLSQFQVIPLLMAFKSLASTTNQKYCNTVLTVGFIMPSPVTATWAASSDELSFVFNMC